MKLTASCSPFEALPPKLWDNIRREIQAAAQLWGVAVEIEETLSLRDAEAKFRAWDQRPREEVDG